MSKRFIAAYAVFFTIVLAALTADIWSNGSPLILKYRGEIYFPALREVPASAFGIRDRLLVDYKALRLSPEDWAIWAPNRWSPNEMNRAGESYPLKPSRVNWLGTDDRGRDVLARLLYGARLTLLFATAVWILSTAIAIVVGAVAGFLGGWVDLLSQRIIEIFSTIPQLFILIFLVTIFEPSMNVLITVNVVFGWIGISYYIRAEALRIRQLEYVEAARSFGASPVRILFRHVIPNSLGPALTLSPFILIGNVTALTALDFMGLGLPPPTPSWGELLGQGQTYFSSAWWLAFFPTAVLFVLLMSVALIGEHLRLRYERPHRPSGFYERMVGNIRKMIDRIFIRRVQTVGPKLRVNSAGNIH